MADIPFSRYEDIAPYTPAQGSHWPEGSKFKLLPKHRQTYFGKVALEQIGGEEVCLLIPASWLNMIFVCERKPAIAYRCAECGKSWTTSDDSNEWAFGHDCEA
jgi:hypothetical protein